MWDHNLCDVCWAERAPVRPPIRVQGGHRVKEVCCGCGDEHESGIYKRDDPESYQCKGIHDGL